MPKFVQQSSLKKMNIDLISQWIKERKSLYPPQMISGAKIKDKAIWQLLENANYAPSHKRTEPWRYHVFSGESLLAFFDEMIRIYRIMTPPSEIKEEKIKKYRERPKILSHLIVICMKRDKNASIPIQEEEYAVACSVQNMLLSMNALNIIGYWSTGAIAFSEEMKQYLNLEGEDRCMGFLQLGVPQEDLPSFSKKKMSSIEAKVTWH